jgi:hypothetical protein
LLSVLFLKSSLPLFCLSKGVRLKKIFFDNYDLDAEGGHEYTVSQKWCMIAVDAFYLRIGLLARPPLLSSQELQQASWLT